MRKANGEQLVKVAKSFIFEAKGQKSENILFTELCERFLQLCKRFNERPWKNLPRVLEYNFSVFKQSILVDLIVHTTREKLREEDVKTDFLSRFD